MAFIFPIIEPLKRKSRNCSKLSMVVHACNPVTQEAEFRRSPFEASLGEKNK
jgi:hypothetical protein